MSATPTLPEPVIERLKKILALAESGVGGEQENARRMLAELCARYGVTPSQLTGEEKTFVKFGFKDSIDGELVTQVVICVCRTRKVRLRKNKRSLEFELTAIQAIDVKECLAHYRNRWRKIAGDAFHAFLFLNKITAPEEEDLPDEKSMPSAEDIEHAKRIFSMMQGMEASHWRKTLKLKSSGR